MSGAILNVKKGTFLGYFHPLYSWEESRYSYSMHFFRNIFQNYPQCATGYPVPVPVPANPANIFQSGSGSGSGQILAGLAGFLKVIQKFSKMLKM